ncbi:MULTISPECIES: hypothetical protein [unclassified Streptomyces]|uniref:hypothetical protein n=1 Tax=unclassified Streptomyces TaxID=2593676 RepID=UPI002E18A5AA|nr:MULTISPECIES: hypothetical protein [unclassified Streptomyces]
MTHIERAQADGVDKGVAVDPTVGREADPAVDRGSGRGARREVDPMVGREADPGVDRGAGRGVDSTVGRETDPAVGRGVNREADPMVGRETDPAVDRGVGRGVDPAVGREADPAVGRGVDPAVSREAGPVAGGQAGPERGARAGRRYGLVPAGERDELEGRLRHALTGFVDEPRASVEEADHVLEDLTARLAETLAGHRRTLRTSWQGSPDDTEQLRQALRDYRETAERLLSL